MARLVEVDGDGNPVDTSIKVDGVIKLGSNGNYVIDEPKRPGATTADRVMAVPAGINRGVTSILGLPVDTIANVVDLGKAGIGYATSKVTGKAPPEWTEIADRKGIVGSGEWIADQLTRGTKAASNATGVKLHSPVEPPRPDDKASRILFSGGQLTGAAVNPDPRSRISAANQAVNAAGSSAGGLLAGWVGETNPEWAGLLSMTPAIMAHAAASGTKVAVRGKEPGRKEMEQRIQDLKNGGVDEPSVGLASGNRLVMGAENMLAQTPFISDMFLTRSQKNIDGMKAKTHQLRDSVSPEFGPVVAGEAIQTDLKGPFRNRVNATAKTLNDRVADEVGQNFYTHPDNALREARRLSTPNPGAPLTSEALINNRIAGISGNLASDVQGTIIPPNPLMNTPTRYQRADGQIFDQPPGIPFSALKNLRTSIGEETNSNAIMGTPEQAQFKRLYGAMSDDMRLAVNAADRQNSGVPVGPLRPGEQPGAIALNRANSFYSTAMRRAEDLNGLANRSTPEGAYNAVSNSLNTGPTIYEKLRGTIDPKTRQKIVATIVDDMGKATPGQQGADGEAWSPRTFLTNFSKLNENGGGDALFTRLPGGQKHADNLKDIAKAADMVSDASKVWANPSGTAPALTARGMGYALTVGAFFQPILAASTAGGLALSHQASQRLLLNPKFVDWLAKAPTVDPKKMQSYTQRFANNAQLWGDKQLQSDFNEYRRLVEEGANGIQ